MVVPHGGVGPDRSDLDKEALTVEDARQRVTRWVEDAPSVLNMVAHDLERLYSAPDAAEYARLCEELAAARTENDLLRTERSEIGDMLAAGLGKVNETLLRFRAPPAPAIMVDVAPAPTGSASTVDTAPTPAPVAPAAPLDVATAPAPVVPAPTVDAAPAPAVPDAAAEPTPAAAPLGDAPPPVEEPAEAGSRRILLVDDDPNFRTEGVHATRRGTPARFCQCSSVPSFIRKAIYACGIVEEIVSLRWPGPFRNTCRTPAEPRVLPSGKAGDGPEDRAHDLEDAPRIALTTSRIEAAGIHFDVAGTARGRRRDGRAKRILDEVEGSGGR